MKLLILGGTADARHLATAVHTANKDLELLYSVAGLVRKPQVPARIVSGGFTQFGGIGAYCQAQKIDGVVNVTHPFSIDMGKRAKQACQALGIKYWRFLRPTWQQQEGDDWRLFDSREALFTALNGYQRTLLTIGQVSQSELSLLNQTPKLWLRTAVPSSFELPSKVTWIKAIGPFKEADELAILQQHSIQAIASKNSGGSATKAKLNAARALKVPVFMLQRPPIDGPVEEDFDALVHQLTAWAKTAQASETKLINNEF